MVKTLKFGRHVATFVAVFVILSLHSSCTSGKEGHIIPSQKLQHILAEMHEADSYIQSAPGKYIPQRYDSLTAIAYYSILKKNGYTHLDYTQSMEYYSEMPDTLDAIYKEVLDILNRKMLDLEKIQNAENKKKITEKDSSTNKIINKIRRNKNNTIRGLQKK